MTESRRRTLARAKKNLGGGDECRSTRLFAKLVSAVERGGVTPSFPSELARENFSDADLRTLIAILQPSLKPSAVVDQEGGACGSSVLRKQLFLIVKRMTRRRTLASLIEHTKTLLKFSSGATIAAGVGYMVFTLASGIAKAAVVAGTISIGAAVPLTVAASALVVVGPSVKAIEVENRKSASRKKQRLRAMQTRGYKAFVRYARMFEAAEQDVAEMVAHPPTKWDGVGHRTLKRACNRCSRYVTTPPPPDSAAMKTLRKKWRRQRRLRIGHNGLAIHLFNPVTGEMRATGIEVCSASRVYRASPSRHLS